MMLEMQFYMEINRKLYIMSQQFDPRYHNHVCLFKKDII